MRYDPLPRPGERRQGPAVARSELRRRRAVVWIAPLAGALIVGGVCGIGLAAAIHMPKVGSLADFTPGQITELYDGTGEVFASFARERRVLLEEGDLPELLTRAVLAAEDANFYRHGGIDLQGVVRAAFRNLGEGRLYMGGSTITMQLARRLFLSPEKRWRRKIEEALLAVELEKNFSKQQILTLYCNIIFYGHGNYGVAAAAHDYFGKAVADLTLAEAATLAGIPQRPTAYSPYHRPDLVVERRNYVLRRMLREGYIGRAEYEAAAGEPLQVVPPRQAEELAPYFAEEVRKYLESRFGTQTLLESGLQVRTTLDPRIQRAAERALHDGLLRLDRGRGWRGPLERIEVADLAEHELPEWALADAAPKAWKRGLVLSADASRARVRIGERVLDLGPEGIEWTGRSRPRDVLARGDVAWFRLDADDGGERLLLEQEPEIEGAVLVLESATGAVRAMVGGWNFERSRFNRATQARRQVGSAFKPFVYGAALEMGYGAADTIFDAPVAFPAAPGQPPYSPRNYYRKYYGITTLRRALEDSFNVSMVKLLDLVGVDQVIDFARRCGIRSELPPYPSLALGSADLLPLEVATAFAAFANQGIYLEPYLIESVSRPDGQVLETHRPAAHKAMQPEIAYVLLHTLEGVIDRGTAASAHDLDLDLAGKTGTTDDNSDAWFVGSTPRYTILAWVGYDLKKSIGRRMTGATAALPIWRAVVEAGLAEGWLAPEERFVPPPGVALQTVEYNTGLLPGPGAERLIEEAFVDGTQPVRQFEPKWQRILALPWYQQRPAYIPKAGEKMPDDVQDWTPILEAWQAKEKEREG